MTEVIQAIFIRETETRSHPKPHTVYQVQVHAAVRNWIIWKRYSEFAKLNSTLTALFPKHPPPVPLPGKSIFPSTFSSLDKIQERRRGLEDYLRGILSSRDDRWRQTDAWREFLGVPSGRPLDATTMYTSENWLDEYNEMTSTAREIRSLINKRGAHAARNEISASHNCTMQAKKLLLLLSTRLSNLESGLSGLAMGTGIGGEGSMAEGELRRRQDMLYTLKNEKDTLLKLVNTATTSFQRPQQQQRQQSQRGTNGRAFGAQAKALMNETEETRGLDNEGLMQYQQQVMQDQDQQVEQFSAILARQRQLGLAIGDELETQNEVLDELDTGVDRTNVKLKFAKKKLGAIK
ncbi:Phox homologous domain-containing protein [Zychaea mexicana]|uniref:PX domain-containing protein n=1 Tax=Zychaea mexicana TaxID=64656 RepID=UPI0022FE5942|nr:PX domain-containing protein [Zychaea mexicana]KAI9489971.1 Phox homologous domain-containing protein [Zychaea mexicana]